MLLPMNHTRAFVTNQQHACLHLLTAPGLPRLTAHRGLQGHKIALYLDAP